MPEQDRPFPHSVETERAFLGCLITDSRWLPFLDLDGRDFYRPDHRALYELMRDMDRRGESIDSVTLTATVTATGRPDRYGGLTYVVELPDGVPATANVEHYARKIRDLARRRRHIGRLQMLTELAWDGTRPIETVEDDALAELLEQDGTVPQQAQWRPAGAIATEEIRRALDTPATEKRGMSTGLHNLDDKIDGLHAPDMIVIGARPAMGKTALAMAIARSVATKSGTAVGVFSLEMSSGQLVQRMISDMGSVDGKRLRTGKMDIADCDRAEMASRRLADVRLYIDDTAELTIRDVQARARRLAATLEGQGQRLGLLVVDYLQLMRGTDERQPRERQVAEISSGLKRLGKDLHVPILVLAQLSRIVEERRDKRPIPSDLRDSGTIEQDADIILFPWRPEVYFPEAPNVVGFCEVIVAKNRHGAMGSADLDFQGKYSRFTDASIDQSRNYRAPKGPTPAKGSKASAATSTTAKPPKPTLVDMPPDQDDDQAGGVA
jgi:replicative DNA helicase